MDYLLMKYNHSWKLPGLLGYTSFGSKNTSQFNDYSFSSVPLLFGARYSFAVPEEKMITPYVGAELGFQFQSF